MASSLRHTLHGVRRFHDRIALLAPLVALLDALLVPFLHPLHASTVSKNTTSFAAQEADAPLGTSSSTF